MIHLATLHVHTASDAADQSLMPYVVVECHVVDAYALRLSRTAARLLNEGNRAGLGNAGSYTSQRTLIGLDDSNRELGRITEGRFGLQSLRESVTSVAAVSPVPSLLTRLSELIEENAWRVKRAWCTRVYAS
jgi:hypothetical protein